MLAQLSTIHYVPPLYGRDEGILHRHFILVSNPNASNTANVIIRDGSGEVLFEKEVSNQATFKAFLGEGAAANGIIDTDQLNTIIRREDNLIVESDIPVYVQIRHTVSQVFDDLPDRHLHGLITSSKGDWAVGSRFRTGFGFSSNSSLDNNVTPDGRSDFISVMATEDNTTVTFSEMNNRVNLGGGVPTPNSIDVLLSAGESFTIAHFPDTDASNLSLNGTLVTGSNPIVVNCGSWALDHSPHDEPDRSQREIAAEQIIPMERLGTEYVVMNVDGVELAEKVIIVGDQDNTNYFLHGSNIPAGTLDAGEFVVLDKDEFTAQGNLYIETSAPTPVYQTTGLEHFSVGYTIVTPLKCWGTQNTIIPRMDDDFVLEESRINIVAAVGTNVSVSGADLAPPEAILGLPEYETYRATPLVTDDITITADQNVQVLTSYRSVARGAATYYAEYFQTDTMIVAELCLGESFIVGNSEYTRTGIYYDTLLNINRCDSLVMLDLTVHEPVQETVFGEVCSGESYSFEGNEYMEAGMYEAVLSTAQGCDSVITLDLIVHPLVFDSLFMDVCHGDEFEGSPVVQDFSIVTVYSTQNNCDSTVTLFVSVLEEFETRMDFTICPEEEIEIDGQFFSAEGMHEIQYTAQNGCDSLLLLQIMHHTPAPLFQEEALCPGSLYNGIAIQQDTVLLESGLSAEGCTTDLFVQVRVLPESIFEQELQFCPGMEYNGIAVFSDSVLIEELQNIHGCDSLAISTILMQSFTSMDTVFLNSGDLFQGTPYFADDLLIQDLMSSEGCDSTAYTYIFINPILTGVVSVNLCPGAEFEGLTPMADTSFTTEHIAANGFDSLTVFNIFVQASYADTTQLHICEGESTLLYGELVSEAGLYENLLRSIHDCDSLLVTELILDPIQESDFDLRLCEGDSLFLAGAFQSTTGVYTELYPTSQNCDSIVRFHLEVLPNVVSEWDVNICADEIYQGIALSQDTIFVENFTGANGCDSTVYTHVAVQSPFASLDTLFVLEEDGFEADTLLVDSLFTTMGCDSIVSTQIILLPSVSLLLQETLCEGATYNGIAILDDTTFIETFFAANGADSTVITQVFVNHPTSFEQSQSLCEGDLYEGMPIYADTTFLDVLVNSLGCDSLLYTFIDIIPPVEDSLFVQLVEGESYAGVFYDSDTIFAETFVTSMGCDSTLTTQIILIPHVFTSQEVFVCENENYLGIPIRQDTVLVETLLSYQGSDSVHTTYVFALDTITTHFEYVACEGEAITLFDQVWFEDETITDLVPNAAGCFDLEVHRLIFNPTSRTALSEEICPGTSYFFNGEALEEAGVYFDTLRNQYDCDSILTLELSLREELSINIEGGSPYCAGDATLLSAAGYESYLWSNGATSSQIEVSEPGNYEVRIIDQNGCTGFGSIQVPPPNTVAIELDIIQPDCQSQAFGAVDILTALNDAPLHYTLNGEPLDNTAPLSELPAGAYELTATDDIGCSQSLSFLIEAFTPPTLTIPVIDPIVLGDSIQLNPLTNTIAIDSISWTPNQFLSCDNCLRPFASPPNDFSYQLTVFTEEGCVLSATINLQVENNYSIYIPNAFSPNADGINDYFTIFADGAVQEVRSLQIYDRWGEQVFYHENFPHNVELEGWDGSFRSEKMQVGVFVYFAEILLESGEVVLEKGDVTLMR